MHVHTQTDTQRGGDQQPDACSHAWSVLLHWSSLKQPDNPMIREMYLDVGVAAGLHVVRPPACCCCSATWEQPRCRCRCCCQLLPRALPSAGQTASIGRRWKVEHGVVAPSRHHCVLNEEKHSSDRVDLVGQQ